MRKNTTLMAGAIALVWLAAAGVVLLSFWVGDPVPPPLPQVVIGLGVVCALVVLVILPVVPVTFASNIEIALSQERVYDRLTDVMWWAAGIPALRRLEVAYARTDDGLVRVGHRAFIGRRIVLATERVEAQRPHHWVALSHGSGTRSTLRRALTPTPTGTLVEMKNEMRVSVVIWAAWLPRRRKLREAFLAELERLKADLESRG